MATSPTAPVWRGAFLRELARSGSVALAADKAGIDRSSAYQARKANPAFAASWDRALSFARLRLSGATEGGTQAHPQPLPRAGGEPVAPETPLPLAGGVGDGPCLRGDEVVRASRAGKPCVVRAGPGRWCADSEQAFLAALAASANVKAAARAAGVSTVAVYNRRRQWPAFARAWDEAKSEGYVRLEMALIHAANATLEPEPEVEADDAFAGPAMTVEQAMKLFFHRAGAQGARGGRGRGYGWRRQEPDIEEVRAEILRRVAAIERAKALRAKGQGGVGSG